MAQLIKSLPCKHEDLSFGAGELSVFCSIMFEINVDGQAGNRGGAMRTGEFQEGGSPFLTSLAQITEEAGCVTCPAEKGTESRG